MLSWAVILSPHPRQAPSSQRDLSPHPAFSPLPTPSFVSAARSASARIARFSAISPFLAALAHFMGGGGSVATFNPRIEDQYETRIQ
jgi:hypothetical protein